jgi:hypothetical protein
MAIHAHLVKIIRVHLMWVFGVTQMPNVIAQLPWLVENHQ